jgi:uncharacterized repeat protein (TIGR01451 family)
MWALLVLAALAGVLKADAQPVTTIYSFAKGPTNPRGNLTLGPDGNFYGTTGSGGQYGNGTVFRVTTNGVITTLASFDGYSYGSGPYAGLTLGADGNFYGTAIAGGTNMLSGGANNTGTIFRVTTNGTLTTVVNFTGANGSHPQCRLTIGQDGSFYGTTAYGGASNNGTVFRVTTNGVLTTLASFAGTNGAMPEAGLTLGLDGSFYGTTVSGGGTNNLGTIFRVTTNGNLTTLVMFTGNYYTNDVNVFLNGVSPYGQLTLGTDGNLYGTTAFGGNPNGDFSGGTVFQVTTNGVLTTLIYFSAFGGINGDSSYAQLIQGADGDFYGTTSSGGANGSGTVFQVTTNGTLAQLASLPGFQYLLVTNSQGAVYVNYTTNNWTNGLVTLDLNGSIKKLYDFPPLVNSTNSTGADAQSGLTLGPDGNFYTAIYGGGASGYGTVVRITTNGTATALASFSGNNGDNPMDALTVGPNGSLYGTANSGGTSGYGTVFKITTGGAITTLVNFDRANDGANPQAGLIVGPGGNFYGTAVGGGSNLLQTGPNSYQAVSDGTVFELTTNGIFTTLTDFNGLNGANPYGGLAVGTDGNLYGTTTYGGISNNGTIFQLLTNGTLTTLTNFTGANGANPFAGLTLGPDGNFYGTSEAGGTNNDGTVFQVTTNGTMTTLVYFNGTNGANPAAGLLLGPDGNFYGTAHFGGAHNDGTVFKVTTGGTLTTLVNFAQTNGAFPMGGLALGPDGNFYGTTELGGISSSAGTVFKMTTNGTLTTIYGFVFGTTNPSGNYPFAGLTLATNGNFIHFYGTTYQGGSSGGGTVFQLNLTTAYAMAENSTNTFYPLTNEVLWVTGGTLSLLSAAATNGTAQITGSGIVFTPAANFIGTATINYAVANNAGGTNNSFITVLVTNVPPVANPDFYTVAGNSSSNVFSPLANDQLGTSDGVLSLVSVSPTNGMAFISGTNVLFTPQTNFTGTATIGYTITDNIGGTNSSLITVTVANASADLSLSASAAPEPVEVGSNLVYSITVSNAGPSAASGVVVSNQLPAGVSFVSATGGATPSGGVLLVNVGSLAVGETNSVQIVVQPSVAGQLTNSFQVFANETDPALTNNSAAVVSTVTNAPVVVLADLSLSARAGPQSGTRGTNLVYFLTVSNAGPATATGVVVSNQILYGIKFISATGGAVPTNGVLFVNVGSLAPGATNLIQIAVQLTDALPGARGSAEMLFTNVFQVFADQTDPDPTNNTATVRSLWGGSGIFGENAYTSVSKAEYDTNVTTTVNLQVTNYSTEIVAKLPNGTVLYDQTFNAPYSDPTVQAAITTAAGDMAGAGAASYTGPAQTSLLQTTNSVSVTVTNPPSTNNIIGTYAYAGPDTYLYSDFGVISGYTFAPIDSYNPVVTNYAIPTGWNGNPVTFTVTAPTNTLDIAESFDTMILSIVTINQTTTNTTTYTNSSVYVMTGIMAQASADVSLSASSIYASLQKSTGDWIYSFTVSNAGPATATGVVVSNQIPTNVICGGQTFNVNFISATGGATPTNDVLLVNIGTLAVGATNLVQIIESITEVGSSAVINDGYMTNVFQVSADQTDPDPTNNSAAFLTPIVLTAFTDSSETYDTNLTATVNQPATNYLTELIARLPNGTVVFDQTYAVPYSNATVQSAITTAAGDLTGAGASSYAGPTETSFLQSLEGSSSVTVTNAIGTNYTSVTSLYIGQQTILVGTNQTQPFFIPGGAVDYDTLVTTVVTNLATTTDFSTNLNSSVYVMTGIVAQADLSLTASAAPEPVGVGSNLVYSISITNRGPNAASGVVVSNHIPAGVAFISATGGTTLSGGVLLVNLGSLANGAVTNAQVIVQPTAAGKLTNLFQVFASTSDPVPTNNSATVVSTVTNAAVVAADLSLTASAAPEPLGVGSNLVYSITVSNAGPSAATGVMVSNRVPVNVTFVSATGGSTPSGGVLLLNLGSLAVDATNSVQIVLQPTVAGKLTNLFQVFASQTDPVLTNNVATVVSTVTNGSPLPVDVALSLMAAPNPVGVGAPLTYSLTVTNNSSTLATGVVVSNTLPPNVTLFSLLPSEGSASNNAGVVTFTVGSLSNGIAATLAIVVIPEAAGQFTNVAEAFSAQPDSQATNNSVTNVTTAVTVPITNLVLTILSPITLNPQTGLFEQKVEVSNGGPATPSSVMVLVSGLAANATLYNATGITNGTPFVQSASPLGVGSNVIFLLEFYVPTRVPPTNLTYTVQAGPPVIPPVVSGTILSISRTIVLANGSVLVEFSTVPGQIYAIQYSGDMVTWLTAVPAITAPANRVQWIDSGPPKTVSNPAQQSVRYYRVILLTAK